MRKLIPASLLFLILALGTCALGFSSTKSRNKDWRICPKQTYVTGLAAESSKYPNDVKLICSAQDTDLITHTSTKNGSSYNAALSCDQVAVGLQARQEMTTGKIVKFGLFRLGKDKQVYHHQDTSSSKTQVFRGGLAWEKPQLCDKEKWLCGVKLTGGSELSDYTIKCCSNGVTQNKVNIRNVLQRDALGRVIQSVHALKRKKTELLDHLNDVDFPYWYNWNFCPPAHYVMGMKLNFKSGGLVALCRSITEVMQIYEVEDKSGSEGTNAEYSDDVRCDGVVIGFQVQTVGDRIGAIRLICMGYGHIDIYKVELDYEYSEQEPGVLTKNSTWQSEQKCGNQEAICGFKVVESRPWKSPKSLKLKCCHVPDVSELCIPRDKYELVTECDGSEALAPTTCSYSKTVGFKRTQSLTKSQIKQNSLHRNLEYHGAENIENTKSLADTASLSNSNMKSSTNSNGVTVGASRRLTETVEQDLTQSKKEDISNNTSEGTSTSKTHSQRNSTQTGTSQFASNRNSSAAVNQESKSKTSTEKQNSVLKVKEGTTVTESQSNSQDNHRSVTKSDTKDRSGSRISSESSTSARGNSRSSGFNVNSGGSAGSGHSNDKSTSHGFSGSVGVGVGPKKGVSVASVNVGGNFELSYNDNKYGNSDFSHSHGQDVSRDSSNSQSVTKNRETQLTRSSQTTRDSSRQEGQQHNSEKDSERSVGRGSEINQEKVQTHGHESERETKVSRDNEQSEHLETGHGAGSSGKVEKGRSGRKSKGQSTYMTKLLKWHFNKEKSMETESSQSNQSERSRSTVNTAQLVQGSTRDESDEMSFGETQGQDSGFTTSHDWTASDTSSWEEETTVAVDLVVPPGVRTKLYQVVGYCSFYKVQTSAFKRVDVQVKEVLGLSECEYLRDKIIDDAKNCEMEISQDYEDPVQETSVVQE